MTSSLQTTPDVVSPFDLTVELCEEILGVAKPDWAFECHAISLALVRSGRVGLGGRAPRRTECRVARGSAPGVGGQHSWVVFDSDCYNRDAVVLDLTLWSYDPSAPVVYVDQARTRPHTPHGSGLIFNYPMPSHGGGKTIELTPSSPLSREAERFLRLLGPLDLTGWRSLAHAPYHGWPAGELTAAMVETSQLTGLIPIDLIGMRTNTNPGNLYLAEDATTGTSEP